MPSLKIIAAISVASYIVGIVAYFSALHIRYNQSFQDVTAVVFWSGIAYVWIALPAYLAVVWTLDRLWCRVFQLDRSLCAILFPLAAAASGVAPTAFIVGSLGGTAESLFSPEATLFYMFFGASGTLFGVLWWAAPVPQKQARHGPRYACVVCGHDLGSDIAQPCPVCAVRILASGDRDREDAASQVDM